MIARLRCELSSNEPGERARRERRATETFGLALEEYGNFLNRGR
jgi:hypothetical protein